MKQTRRFVALAVVSICLLVSSIATGCSGRPDHWAGERLCLVEGLRIYHPDYNRDTGEREWVLKTKLESGVWTVVLVDRDRYTLRKDDTTVHGAAAAAVDERSKQAYGPCRATETKAKVKPDGSALGGEGR